MKKKPTKAKTKVQTKAQKIANFNPSSFANTSSGIYGLPFTAEESDIVIIQMPWEVTVSSGHGTQNGPKRIIEGSMQVDLGGSDVWDRGIAVLPNPAWIPTLNKKLMGDMLKHKAELEKGKIQTKFSKTINIGCKKMVDYVEETAKKNLDDGKIVGMIGGDHSTPLGLINALSSKYAGKKISILHIDAHLDLRVAYLSCEYSHASIMYNALTKNKNLNLASVGIRDYCEEELEFARKNESRIDIFYDDTLSYNTYNRVKSWSQTCDDIIFGLSPLVYISFDVDGLKQIYCPNTGTPVPGGLEYNEALFLLKEVSENRKIIGFDINETGDGEWDGTVSAQLLYKMCHFVSESH